MEFNSADGLYDETALSIVQWITRIFTIVGLDTEGDINDTNGIGWSGIDIPTLCTTIHLPSFPAP